MQIRQNTNETNYKMTMYKRDKIPNDIRNNKIQKWYNTNVTKTNITEYKYNKLQKVKKYNNNKI